MQMAQFQKVYDRFTAIRYSLQHRHSMCYTALSPVSALPHEIMREIHLTADAGTPQELRGTLRRSISSVSNDWRNVALTMPTWATHRLRTITEASSIPLPLDDSRCKEISLYIDNLGDSHQAKHHSLANGEPKNSGLDVLRQKLVHLEWTSGPNFSEVLRTFQHHTTGNLQIEFPSLHTLTIRSQYSNEVYLDISAMKFSQLRFLRLDQAVIVRSNSSLAPNLLSVNLARVAVDQEMCSLLLHGAPNLEAICANATKGDEEVVPEMLPPPGPPGNGPVLRHLKDVRISGDEKGAVHILGFMECPALRTIDIRVDADHEPRLSIWCNTPTSHPYGLREFSISNCLYRTVSSPHSTLFGIITTVHSRQLRISFRILTAS